MTLGSHQDLHPTHGARFVAERLDASPLTYAVVAYLPEGQRLEGTLRWPEGRAAVEPDWPDRWAAEEVLKLARVLRRTAQPRATRWRAREPARPPADDNS